MLDKDVLGLALYDSRQQFNNKTYDQLVDEFGTIEEARKAACKADAEAIIEHFKVNGLIRVTTTGTASAQTGTGTIE